MSSLHVVLMNVKLSAEAMKHSHSTQALMLQEHDTLSWWLKRGASFLFHWLFSVGIWLLTALILLVHTFFSVHVLYNGRHDGRLFEMDGHGWTEGYLNSRNGRVLLVRVISLPLL